MEVDEVVDLVQSQMADGGVYRTDSFMLQLYNDAVKLVNLFTLNKEGSSTVEIDGTRNYVCFPDTSDNEKCLAISYVSDGTTGYRINPVPIEQFEFYDTQWEGRMGTATVAYPMYYTTTGRWAPEYSAIVLCPMANYGDCRLYVVGIYIADDAISGDEVELNDLQLEAVVKYMKFMCFISEPARAEEALAEYRGFLSDLNGLVAQQKAKFPSGRDVEPVPVELKQLSLVRYQKKTAAEDEDEG